MKKLVFLGKISVATLIIWFVWDTRSIFQLKYVATKTILLFIVPTGWLLNQVLTSLRLHAIFKGLGRPIKLGDVFRANMSSLFVGNIIPGIIGTDVIKFFYLKKNNPSVLNTELAFILTIDRILGLIAIIFLCSFFGLFVMNGVAIKSSHKMQFLTFLPLLCLLLSILILALLHSILVYHPQQKTPKIVQKLGATYKLMRMNFNRRSLIPILIYNVLAVLFLLTGIALVGAKLQEVQGYSPMLSLQFFLIPLVLITTMLPLTPMGIGVAQITLAEAYGLFGLDQSVGFSLSTLNQLSLLSVSLLIGGATFIFTKNRSESELPKVQILSR